MYKLILGIESSCDDTGVSIIAIEKDGRPKILSNLLHSQQVLHSAYGGVVPEIASRNHMLILPGLTRQALLESKIDINNIDGIAVTSGPGLIGGLLVGLMFAKGLAFSMQKPFIGINHLEGHALTVRLIEDIPFPFLLLLVSGGHCQIIIVQSFGVYKILGSTIDDAIGECIDKIARALKLGYPGGPIVEQIAKGGNDKRFVFPKPLCNTINCNFSLSGLKTAVIREIEKHQPLNQQDIADFCASLQYTILQIIINRLQNALSIFSGKNVVMAGGVAANQYFKTHIKEFLSSKGRRLITPSIDLSTDNAAMIAWAGYERFSRGYYSTFDLEPQSRWPLGSFVKDIFEE